MGRTWRHGPKKSIASASCLNTDGGMLGDLPVLRIVMASILLARCAGQNSSTETLITAAFSTKGMLPIVLVAPIQDATVSQATAVFSWSERLPQYQLEIARDDAFLQRILVKTSTQANYAFNEADLIAGTILSSGTYFWRVQIPFVADNLRSSTGRFYLQVVPKSGSGEFGKIYVNKNSLSSLQNGGAATPFKTIQAAIVAANTYRNFDSNIFFNVLVAQGAYNESITQYAGISLYGGYNADLLDANGEWTRNTALYTSSITAAGMRAVSFGSDVTTTYRTATVLDGFTITGGSGEAPYGVYLNNASPTITNNRINSGTPVFQVSALYAMNNSFPIIRDNTITASQFNASALDANNCNGIVIERNTIVALGGGTQYSGGLVLKNSTAVRVHNNQILGGINGGFGNVGVELTSVSGEISGNTIYAGQGSYSYGIELKSGVTGSIINNIVSTSTAAVSPPNGRFCIGESGIGNTPAAVQNNNLFGCPQGVYRDAESGCGGGVNCSLAQMTALGANYSGNVSINNAGSQLFIDIDGADNTLGTMADNDWRLTTNAAICDVRGGGVDLTTFFSTDRVSANRTLTLPSGCTPGNAGAAGWSMGAHESD